MTEIKSVTIGSTSATFVSLVAAFSYFAKTTKTVQAKADVTMDSVLLSLLANILKIVKMGWSVWMANVVRMTVRNAMSDVSVKTIRIAFR